MTVHVARDAPNVPLSDREAGAAVDAALEHGGRPGIDVEVLLTGDARIAEVHGRFLGDSRPTDVIAFDLGEDGNGPAAEIYASVECARRVAAERGVEPARELALYLVHGSLHLCGFNDGQEDERAAMRRAEAIVLDALGYSSDSLPHDDRGDG